MSRFKRSAKIFSTLLSVGGLIFLFNIYLSNFSSGTFELYSLSLDIPDEDVHVVFKLDKHQRWILNSGILEIQIRQTGTIPLKLKISLNKKQLFNTSINTARSQSFNVVLPKKILKKINQLSISASHQQWTVSSLKLKNFYGFSKGWLGFIITHKEYARFFPNWRQNHTSTGRFFLLFFLYLMILIIFLPRKFCQEYNRHLSIWIKCSIIALGIFLILPVILFLITKFRLILSFPLIMTVLIFILILTVISRNINFHQKVITFPILILLIYSAMALFLVHRPHHQKNFSGLLKFRASRINRFPREKISLPLKDLIIRKRGYDGQFYYYMATDPLLLKLKNVKNYRRVVDEPRFRYSRMGYASLTWILSLGSIKIYPEVMVLIILFSHLFGSFFLYKILEFYHKNPWLVFLYLLIPGYIWSLRSALPESIAGAFLLAGFYFYLKKRLSLTVLYFGSAILFRETSILFLLILVLFELFHTKKWQQSLIISLSFLPYLLWKIYLTFRLFPDFGWSTLYKSAKDLAIPFSGFVDLYSHIANDTYRFPEVIATAYLYPMILTLIFGVALWYTIRKIDFLSLILLLYSMIYISLNYPKIWIHMGNGIRGTYDIFIIFMLFFISRFQSINKFWFYLVFSLAMLVLILCPDTVSILTFGIISI